MKISRMRMLVVSACLVLALALASLVAACAKPAPTPTPAPAPKPAPTTTTAPTATPPPSPKPTATPTETAKPIQLTLSTYYTQDYTFTEAPFKVFSNKLQTRSNGRIQTKYFHSGQLFGGGPDMAAVQQGNLDIALTTSSYFTGTIPAVGIEGVPFLLGNPDQAYTISKDVLHEALYKPEFAKQNVVCLAASFGAGTNIVTVQKAARTIADIKGLKIRVSGASLGKLMEYWGAVPVTVASAEIYTAFQRKTIDAGFLPWTTTELRKLYEVSKYILALDITPTHQPIIMNKAKWDSLPPDLQKIVQDAANEFGAESQKVLKDDYLARNIKLLKDKGMEIYYPTPQDVAPFQDAAKPLEDWWVTQYPAGKAILDLVAKWKQSHNVK